MSFEEFELSWIGASGGCADLSMNNQAVVAGTRLRIGLRHLKTALELRPEEIYIFAAYEKQIGRVVARITGRAYGVLLDRLDLKPAVMSDFVAATDPWPLKAPPSIKGRLEVYCSFEHDGSHHGPSLTSLAYQTAQYSGTTNPKELKGSVDVKGLGSTLEVVSGGQTTTTSFTAIAAIDPQMYVDALIPGDGAFEEYISHYIREIARDAGLELKELESAFYSMYRDLIHPSAAKQLEVGFRPEFLSLGPGESQVVHLQAAWHGRPGSSTLMAVRLRDTENRDVQTVSDLIIVGDEFSSAVAVGRNAQGDSIIRRPEREGSRHPNA